jgi:hypothetical protein
MMAHGCNAIYMVEGYTLKSALNKNLIPYSKNKLKHKRARNVVQVIEHLPNKCQAMSSNASIAKKNPHKNDPQRGSYSGLS